MAAGVRASAAGARQQLWQRRRQRQIMLAQVLGGGHAHSAPETPAFSLIVSEAEVCWMKKCARPTCAQCSCCQSSSGRQTREGTHRYLHRQGSSNHAAAGGGGLCGTTLSRCPKQPYISRT